MSKQLAVVAKNLKPKATDIHIQGDQFFIRLAKEMGALDKPAQLAEWKLKLKAWAENIKAFEDLVKDAIKRLVVERGTQTTEAGSKEFVKDGWVFPIRPQKTGYDPRLIESMLRAKGIDPSVHMNVEMKFTVNETKLGVAIETGVLTQEEVNLCRYPLEYAVMQPKQVENENG